MTGLELLVVNGKPFPYPFLTPLFFLITALLPFSGAHLDGERRPTVRPWFSCNVATPSELQQQLMRRRSVYARMISAANTALFIDDHKWSHTSDYFSGQKLEHFRHIWGWVVVRPSVYLRHPEVLWCNKGSLQTSLHLPSEG